MHRTRLTLKNTVRVKGDGGPNPQVVHEPVQNVARGRLESPGRLRRVSGNRRTASPTPAARSGAVGVVGSRYRLSGGAVPKSGRLAGTPTRRG
jgi:hypothetical protein